MGAALNAAAAMDAYTLSDRGTWLSFGNKDGLQVAFEGDPRLLNRYDVILLNPGMHPQAKQEPALFGLEQLMPRFAGWRPHHPRGKRGRQRQRQQQRRKQGDRHRQRHQKEF